MSRNTFFLTHLGLDKYTDSWALAHLPGLEPAKVGPWESVFLKGVPGDSDSQPGWWRDSEEEELAVHGR